MAPRKGRLGGQTPDQVQALLDQGLNQRTLAQRLGITHQAVNRFVRRYCLSGSGLRVLRARQAKQLIGRREQVRQLIQSGHTSVKVAEWLGVSPATISLDRRALCLGRVFRKPEQRLLRGLCVDQIRARLKTISRAQLARELGITSSAVYRFCRQTAMHGPLGSDRREGTHNASPPKAKAL